MQNYNNLGVCRVYREGEGVCVCVFDLPAWPERLQSCGYSPPGFSPAPPVWIFLPPRWATRWHVSARTGYGHQAPLHLHTHTQANPQLTHTHTFTRLSAKTEDLGHCSRSQRFDHTFPYFAVNRKILRGTK